MNMTGRCHHTGTLLQFTSDRVSMLFVTGCSLMIAMLSSCIGINPIQSDGGPDGGRIFVSNYSIIFVIHGDNDYLVHDAEGNEYTADEAVLSEAKITAQLNPKGSVFIFHQRPKRNVLFFFPIHDGEFYYYHNGRLAAYEEYWRDRKDSPYEPELELYRRYHGESQSEMMSMFLYYGHQIPESGGRGYDASYPERPFTVTDLGGVLKEFTRNASKFDMVSLSTCYGGTPFTVDAVAPYTKYIIASPENLHLSYFNFRSLDRLDTTALQYGAAVFAPISAERAFARLTSDVQTNVSVAVYDVSRVREYVDTVLTQYRRTLNASGDGKNFPLEHCDCAELPEYQTERMSDGVQLFYRPARFGRSKNIVKHSGWECIRRDERGSKQ